MQKLWRVLLVMAAVSLLAMAAWVWAQPQGQPGDQQKDPRLQELQQQLLVKAQELRELMNAEQPNQEAIKKTQAEVRALEQEIAEFRPNAAERRERRQLQQRQAGQEGGQDRMRRATGMMQMMQPPVIAVAGDSVYVAQGGWLFKFDANTLELQHQVHYFPPPGAPPPPPNQ